MSEMLAREEITTAALTPPYCWISLTNVVGPKQNNHF